MRTREMGWLAAGLLLAALPARAEEAAMEKRVTVRPTDNGAELRNPGMGWVLHYYDNVPSNYGSRLAPSNTLPDWPGLNLIYLRIPWAYLEPEEGVFNWSVVDTPMQRFAGRGIQASFRFSCSESWMEYPTPEWVKKAGAKGYRFTPGKGILEDGAFWEPDFDAPVFLEKVDRFLAAAAERYDGHPDVAYIDVGSFGVWGEGHTWSSTRKAYPNSTIKRHIDLHLKHFKRTPIIGMDDFLSRPGTDTPLQAGLQRRGFDLVVPLDWRGKSFLVRGGLWRPGQGGTRLVPWAGEEDRSVRLGTLAIGADGSIRYTPEGKPIPEDTATLPAEAEFAVACPGIEHDPVWQPHSLKLDVRFWLRGPEVEGVRPYLHLVDPATGKEVFAPHEEREDEELTRYMAERGLGLRDDSILVQPTPSGYFHGRMAQAFWRKSPVTLESEHYGGSAARGCWGDGSGFLQSIEDYHASYASIHWWPEEFLERNRELVRKINLRMGYRFQPVEVSWPEAIPLGGRLKVRWEWKNAGVAPPYRDAFPCLTLKDAQGGLVAVLVDDRLNLRSLPVGRADGVPAVASERDFLLPFQLGAGEYEVFVSVGDRLGKPEIALPVEGDDGTRRYRVGRCVVQGDYRLDLKDARIEGGKLALILAFTVHRALPEGVTPFFHKEVAGKLVAPEGLPAGDAQGAALRQAGVAEVRHAMSLPALKPGESAEVWVGLWLPARIGKPDERLMADNAAADRRVLLGRVKAGPTGELSFERK